MPQQNKRDSGNSLVMMSPVVGGMDTFDSPRFLSDLPMNTAISYYAFPDVLHQPDKATAVFTMQAWKRVFLSAPDLSKVQFDTSTPALATAVYETFTVTVNKTPIMCTPLLLLEPSNVDDANVDVLATQDPISKMNMLIVYTRRAVKYGERPRFALWEYASPLFTRRLKCAYSKRLGFEGVHIEPYAAALDKLCTDLTQCRKSCLELNNNHMVMLSIISLCERLFETMPLHTPLDDVPTRPSAEDVLACNNWSQVDKIPADDNVDWHKTAHIAHTIHYLLCYYIIHEPKNSSEQLVMLGFITRVLLHCMPDWTEVVYAAVTMVHQLSVREEWRCDWETVFARLQSCNNNTRLWAHRHIRIKCL